MKRNIWAVLCGILSVGVGTLGVLSVHGSVNHTLDYTVQDVKYLQDYLLCCETPDLSGSAYNPNDNVWMCSIHYAVLQPPGMA